MATPTSKACDVFASSRDRFLQSLGPREKLLYSPCASEDDFLLAIAKMDVLAKQHVARRGKITKSIQSLSKLLAPYFEIVNIFVQSNPEFSALFWGAFRLVLELASNLVSFFEKLLDLLAQLNDVFLRYEDILQVCNDENSSRIRHGVEAIYVDLLDEIFQCAVKIFTRSTGMPKRTPVVLGSLMWHPFDARFQDLLTKMNVHKHNVAEELRIWKIKRDEKYFAGTASWREYLGRQCEDAEEERRLMSKERDLMQDERIKTAEWRTKVDQLLSELMEARSNLEEQRLEKEVARIQAWLQCASPSGDIREANSCIREESTGTWILDHPQYQDWLRTEASGLMDTKTNLKVFGRNMIWIHGHPGAGKTVLATSVLEALEGDVTLTDMNSEPESKVLYHFFRFDLETTTSPTAAFRSLLSQLLWRSQKNRNIIDKFAFLMGLNPHSATQQHATPSVIVDLLEASLSNSDFIIVDGVDEYIRKFSFNGILRLVDDGVLPGIAADKVDELTEHLVRGADGMFLWSRLMIEYLQSSALSRERRMTTIKNINFPEGLEKMYLRILLLINQSGKTTAELASSVFTWLTHQRQPMTSLQTRQALCVQKVWLTGDDREEVAEFEKAVIMSCHGLVEMESVSSWTISGRGFRFIHLTARDVFLSLAQSGSGVFENITSASKAVANLNAGKCCLEQLLFQSPCQTLSGKFSEGISAAQLAEMLPFTDYAALHWIDHMAETVPQDTEASSTQFRKAFDRFTAQLSAFLRKPKTLSSWLEAYYTTSSPHTKEGGPPASQIRNWCAEIFDLSQVMHLNYASEIHKSALELATDLERICMTWHDSMIAMPHIVWDEAGAMGQGTSGIFFTPESARVTSRALEAPTGTRKLVPDFSKSAISADGSVLGVLGIWDWDGQWGEDWVSTYELWSMDTGKSGRLARVAETHFYSLDGRKKQDLMLTYQSGGHGALSISPDCLSFAVFTDIIRLEPLVSSQHGADATEPVSHKICFLDSMTQLEREPNPDVTPCGQEINFSPEGSYLTSISHFRLQDSYSERRTDLYAFKWSTDSAFTARLMSTSAISDIALRADTSQPIFHPRLPLCVFVAEQSLTHPSLYIWNFALASSPCRGVGPSRAHHINVQFSACGSYVISKLPQTPGLLVTPVPEDLISFSEREGVDKASAINSSESFQPVLDSKSSSDISLLPLGLAKPLALQARHLIETSTRELETPNTATKGFEVAFTHLDDASSSTSRAVAIPKYFRNFRSEVRLPQAAGDSAKIIFHIPETAAQVGTQAGGSDGHFSNLLPLVVERDPRFFSTVQDTLEPLELMDWTGGQDPDIEDGAKL
ncbi:hypothetical protein QBC44DRAFT_375961 [Cladorrhinum sp. PSN332]|nr:hypothetical protein QBC44DRAFT_375961 [Cladorrhinum sp. PSN332]